MTSDENSAFVRRLKEQAAQQGIKMAVITDLSLPEELITQFDRAVMNTPMASLKNRRNERLMISPPLKEAKSMLIGLVPYPAAPDNSLIATYALFEDYHTVITEKLLTISTMLSSQFVDIKLYPFVDSRPVAEKLFAIKAGLGFRGKNTLIINREHGSRFFICGFLISCELPIECYDDYNQNISCGDCYECERACPTGALHEGQLDARKCLAWQTIEFKGTFADEMANKNNLSIFGCGLCEKVCSFNKGKPEKQNLDWKIRFDLASANINELKELAQNNFKEVFRGLPIERTGGERLLRNIERCLAKRPIA